MWSLARAEMSSASEGVVLVEFVVRGVVVVESKGSRLERTEPGSDTGSWGRQATRVRRMETGMLDRSRLSMCMVPFLRLRRRRRARRVEDLPLRTGEPLSLQC